ncbi:Adenylosuccinate synthetase [Biscogniauxia marginata]|nr:Adenylosuccinate synthetase [Biscogniauxia marginata]
MNDGNMQLCARAVANGVSLLFHLLPTLIMSLRSQVNLDLHAAVDGLEELGERKIGTTRRGIGPSYRTKAARSGICVHDIFHQETFERKLRKLPDGYRKSFGYLLKYDVEDEIQRFRKYCPKLAGFCVDAVHYMNNAQERNYKILIEGANALMLDIDYGTYPCRYTTRVSEGIFKTENTSDIGAKLQDIDREWGFSTGRKRRCGWFDFVVLKYLTAINHYSCFNLYKLDALDTFPVAVAYKDLETGDTIENFPADLEVFEKCSVVYHEMEGWQQSTTRTKTFEVLPKQAQAYVRLIEEHCGVLVAWIGTGPNREDIISRPIPASS